MPDSASRFSEASNSYTQAAYQSYSRNVVMNEPTLDEMMAAIIENDFDTVHRLLDRGYDLNYTLPKYEHVTPLHLATAEKKGDIVQILLARGANVNAKTSPGNVATLAFAAEMGDLLTTRRLLGKGATIDARDDDGFTALHTAAAGGFADIVLALLGGGADISAESNDGLQAVHIAAATGHPGLVRTLIHRGASANTASHDGTVPLHMAAAVSEDVVRTLVNEGAEIDIRDKLGVSPLDIAVTTSNLDTARILLDYGATQDAADYLNLEFPPPLGMAVADRNLEMIQLLVEGGASFNLDGLGSVLYLAISEAAPSENVVNLLLDLGANVDGGDAFNAELETPALAAAVVGQFPIVTTLVDRGADVTRKNTTTGRTLLHEVAICGPLDLAKRIVRRNPELVVARDEFGETPADYAQACTTSAPGMAEFLETQVTMLGGVSDRRNSIFGTSFEDDAYRMDFSIPSRTTTSHAGCGCDTCREMSAILESMPALKGCNCPSCSKKVLKPARSGCNCASCQQKAVAAASAPPNLAPPGCNCASCQKKTSAPIIPSISSPSMFDDLISLPQFPPREALQHSNCSCSICREKLSRIPTPQPLPRMPTPEPPLINVPGHSMFCQCAACTGLTALPTLSSLRTPLPAHATLSTGCNCASCQAKAEARAEEIIIEARAEARAQAMAEARAEAIAEARAQSQFESLFSAPRTNPYMQPVSPHFTSPLYDMGPAPPSYPFTSAPRYAAPPPDEPPPDEAADQAYRSLLAAMMGLQPPRFGY
jgi:ankyrin repeat protein